MQIENRSVNKRGTRLLLIDIESVMVRGMERTYSMLKYKYEGEWTNINIGGLAYLCQIVSIAIVRGQDIILFHNRNESENELFKDPLLRLQLDILLDKFESTNIPIMKSDNKALMEEDMIEYAKSAYTVYNGLQIYSDNKEFGVYIIPGSNNALFSNGMFYSFNFFNIETDIKLECNSMLFYISALECFEDAKSVTLEYQNYVKENYRNFMIDGKISIYNSDDASTEFLRMKYKEGIVPKKDVIKMLSVLADNYSKYFVGIKYKDWSFIGEYNLKGLELFLSLIQQKYLLNMLELSDKKNKLNIEWLSDKLNYYLSGSQSVDTGLPMETNYFSNNEKVATEEFEDNSDLSDIDFEDDYDLISSYL